MYLFNWHFHHDVQCASPCDCCCYIWYILIITRISLWALLDISLYRVVAYYTSCLIGRRRILTIMWLSLSTTNHSNISFIRKNQFKNLRIGLGDKIEMIFTTHVTLDWRSFKVDFVQTIFKNVDSGGLWTWQSTNNIHHFSWVWRRHFPFRAWQWFCLVEKLFSAPTAKCRSEKFFHFSLKKLQNAISGV